MGLFPVLSDYIMAVNYLMTAFSLYQIFYDKAIKIVYGAMYLVFLALDIWWLIAIVILMKNKACISDVTSIENTYSYDAKESLKDPNYTEMYIESMLLNYTAIVSKKGVFLANESLG